MCPAIDFLIAEHHAKQFLRVPATRGAERLVFLFVETLTKSERGVAPYTTGAYLLFGHLGLRC